MIVEIIRLICHLTDTVDVWRVIITGNEIDHSSSNYKNIRTWQIYWPHENTGIYSKAILHQSIRWLFSLIVLSSIFIDHYSDVIMSTMVYEITGVSIAYSTVCSGKYQRNNQSSTSLAFLRGIHRTDEFPRHWTNNAETVFNWWRHHVYLQRLSQRGRNFPTTLWYRALAGGIDIRK